MIISEVMTTKLITVTPDDTLSHAASLLRQYQFHHLPVVKASSGNKWWDKEANSPLLLEGLLTSQDIDLAVAVGTRTSNDPLQRPWQEQRVVEIMQQTPICVNPNTSVAAAAQILVERGMNCLPVVEYSLSPNSEQALPELENQPALVGLLTRSDLLIALARAMGAYEPGMQLAIRLPGGDPTPLATLLLLARELHIQIRSVISGPMKGSFPTAATVRLGTINPAPLLARLKQAGVVYEFVDFQAEENSNG